MSRNITIVIAILLLVIGLLLIGASAFAESYYDRNGQYQGNSTQSGNTKTYHDKNGTMTGYDSHSGNETRHYDRNGQYQGRTR
jgi:hypothetical protein